MTGERPGGNSPMYGLYGTYDPDALTMGALLARGAVLHQIPMDVLVAAETGIGRLSDDAIADIRTLDGLPLRGAVGFDDWWTTALEALNPGFPLSAARRLVTDKAALYQRLTEHGLHVPDFTVGALTPALLRQATDRFGPRPVLKPATGAGSRGVYRMRDDLTSDENMAVYRQHLALGHIDSAVPILVTQYLGGPQALEIGADLLVADGRTVTTVVHEKGTATENHPFVDRVMLSPPSREPINEALPALPATTAALPAALGMRDGTIHAELRLHDHQWYLLDIGIRPGSGLVAHSVQARTGVDPRLLHLRASIADPVTATAIKAATGTHPSTVIACGYVTPADRSEITLERQAELAAILAKDPDVIGWHLNASAVHDQIYLPDAGLSIGIGAPDTHTALGRLRSTTEPFQYVTS